MMDIVGPTSVSQVNSLNFMTSQTLRDESIDLSTLDADFAISVDGTIYKIRDPSPTQATVILEGGLDTFANEKQQRYPMFYMTERQKLSIYAILKALANRTYTASVSADNSTLQQIVHATYINYLG